MADKTIWTVIIVIAIVILLVVLFMPKANSPTEQFMEMDELSQYYLPSDVGGRGLAVDRALCHPRCCGSQSAVGYDGLTANEIKETMAMQASMPETIRTNYTCANGNAGAGCPCFDRKMFTNLVNRGQN